MYSVMNSLAYIVNLNYLENGWCTSYPGYQRFFSRAAGIFGVGRRPKPRAAKPREKPLARSGAFYRSR